MSLWRKAQRGLRTAAQDDSGVAALAVAGAISIVAFTALSLFLSSFAGTRALERAQASARSGGSAIPAVLAYFYQQATPILPCPDRDLDGIAEAACTGGGNARSGTLPWATLGLSKQDALDGNGRYFSYVVSNTARNVCFSVANDYDAADTEFTGSLIEATDLELITTAQSAGEGRYVPFAIISHGPNGYGTLSASGTATQAPPAAHTFEDNNDNDNPTVIYTGPRDEDGTNQFDDFVIAPTRDEMQTACETLTPGGELNASLSDNFDSGSAGIDTTNFAVSSTDAPTKTRDANNNGVASFTTANSYLATATSYDFTTTVRPVYVAAMWTPDPAAGGATLAGFSIATRATTADLTGGTDTFNGNGITFRFDSRTAANISAGAGTANTVSIRENVGGELANSGASTYQLITGEPYLLEVYDNGTDVWMRITQRDDSTNTLTLTTTTSADQAGDQRIVFINGTATDSYIDDVIVGLPMLALELDGDGDYVATAGNDNGTATGDITLEAWIKPKSLPLPGATPDPEEVTIASQWDDDDHDVSSYRLYLDGERNGQMVFEVAGSDGTNPAVDIFNLGFRPTIGEWAHVAVTYNGATQAMRFYLDGILARSGTGTVHSVRAAAQHFAVGADSVTTPPRHFFHGNISDVRVWDDVRTATEVEDNFQRRLQLSGNPGNLLVNWRFDSESDDAGGTDPVIATPAIGANGVLTGNATYAAALAVYFRPFSTEVCDGYKVGAYQCEFRTSAAAGLALTAAEVQIPNNLSSVYAKVCGAGGGAYDVGSDERLGGSGGFSAGLISSINSSSISGNAINIYVGGYGFGSSTEQNGAGGGAGSGVFNTSGDAALIAGGGGGASFSEDAGTGCDSATDEDSCGLGGGGGGATVTTVRAADEGSDCGGRGGNTALNSPDDPPAADCDSGGANPPDDTPSTGLNQAGGGDTGGGAGGTSAVMAGGTGYVSGANNKVGGGGGGGGAIGGEAGGFDSGTNFAGYGGGGGSGSFDAAGVNGATGEVGGTATTSTPDTSRTGNLQPDAASQVQRRRIVNVSPDNNVTVGDSISGTCIPAGTLIVGPQGPTSIDIDQDAVGTNATCMNVTLSITPASGGTTTSAPGGDNDPDYAPSYAPESNPGQGGTAGDVNGRSGAIVLKW